MNYKAICELTVYIAKEAGEFIHSMINKLPVGAVEVKGLNNFVTEVDKNTEVMIINKLKGLVKGAGFIAEEGTDSSKGDKFNWIIDPLDGTTNFIHGSPPVSVSIALVEDGMPVVGVIYEVWMKEAFYSWKGGPAFLNGKEMRVSNTKSINDSLIACGFPYHDSDQLKRFLQSLDYFFVNTHGVRRLGSAATDLAYVACGRYDGFYEYNLSPWDVAAGALIVQQAGGMVSDFKGGNDYVFGKQIVAANSNIHKQFLQDVSRIMKI